MKIKILTIALLLLCSLFSFAQEKNAEKIKEKEIEIAVEQKKQENYTYLIDELEKINSEANKEEIEKRKKELEKIKSGITNLENEKLTLELEDKTNLIFEKTKELKEIKEKAKDNDNSRFSFMLGVGASFIGDHLYQNPAVNLSNNNVIIEESQRIKTNISLGIVYTPYKRIFNKGTENEEIVPYGISFATFINPIALTQATENQKFFSITDFGVGIGYKFAGNVIVMGTVEFLSVRQPKKWFIDEFKNNDKPYLVNDAPQLSFDTTDNNIFKTKIAATFGFKICYSFDVIKNFQNTRKEDTPKKK